VEVARDHGESVVPQGERVAADPTAVVDDIARLKAVQDGQRGGQVVGAITAGFPDDQVVEVGGAAAEEVSDLAVGAWVGDVPFLGERAGGIEIGPEIVSQELGEVVVETGRAGLVLPEPIPVAPALLAPIEVSPDLGVPVGRQRVVEVVQQVGGLNMPRHGRGRADWASCEIR
jgi:hypothetical protein